MRFPRDEWTNALTYYRPASKTVNQPVETLESALQKKHSDDEKENESHRTEEEIIKSSPENDWPSIGNE